MNLLRFSCNLSFFARELPLLNCSPGKHFCKICFGRIVSGCITSLHIWLCISSSEKKTAASNFHSLLHPEQMPPPPYSSTCAILVVVTVKAPHLPRQKKKDSSNHKTSDVAVWRIYWIGIRSYKRWTSSAFPGEKHSKKHCALTFNTALFFLFLVIHFGLLGIQKLHSLNLLWVRW